MPIHTPTDPDKPVETPQNVVPFRPLGEREIAALTPVENNAFNELARQLSARLERDATTMSATVDRRRDGDRGRACRDGGVARARARAGMAGAAGAAGARRNAARPRAARPAADRHPDLPARPPALRQPRLPARIGYDSLHALEQAGGLDALYVEAGVSPASSTSEAGTPVTISAARTAGSARDRSAAVHDLMGRRSPRSR